MKKQKTPRLSINESVSEKQKNELFRENIIEYIKKYDHSYEHTDFSGYSTTKLVLLKVDMEIIKGGL